MNKSNHAKQITPYVFSATLAVAAMLTLNGCKAKPATPTDQSLTQSVSGRIAADSALSGEPIQATAASGIVTLNGTVTNDASRSLASDDAAQVPGVKTVINNLTVQPATQAATPAPTQPAPDSAQVVAPLPAPIHTEKSDRREKTDRHAQRAAMSNQSAANQLSQVPPPMPQGQPQNQNQALQTQPPAPIVRANTASPAPTTRMITLPSGTTIAVRMNQTLDSATTQPDDIFKGTLASDIVVDGMLVLPQGTPVLGRVLTVQEAAHFKGDSLLTITLTEIDRSAATLKVSTDSFSKAGTGRGKNTVEKVGGGAALGAILGGLFGGGKGAAIGALAGGGAGAGVNAATRGQQVQIPSESVVRFSLAKDLPVTVKTVGSQQQGEGGLQRHPANPSDSSANPNPNQ